MKWTHGHGRPAAAGAGLLVGFCLVASVGATEPCSLCNEAVVINSALAKCFLDEYPHFANKDGSAIAVDLSGCDQDRGVIEPLATPEAPSVEPDMQFMLTRNQLGCLKSRLEQPNLVLDPSATIELGNC